MCDLDEQNHRAGKEFRSLCRPPSVAETGSHRYGTSLRDGVAQAGVRWDGEELLGKEPGTMKTNHDAGGGGRIGVSRAREVMLPLRLALVKRALGPVWAPQYQADGERTQ